MNIRKVQMFLFLVAEENVQRELGRASRQITAEKFLKRKCWVCHSPKGRNSQSGTHKEIAGLLSLMGVMGQWTIPKKKYYKLNYYIYY